MALRCVLTMLSLLLAATVACRDPCAPSPPCKAPSYPIASAEAGEELGGRAHWYAKSDTAGSSLAEPGWAPFVAGGANGTRRAAQISGKLAPRVDAFAVLVLQLDRAVDTILSRYLGLSFWAKIESPSRAETRFTVTCWNGDSFAGDLRLYEGWTEYTVPFKALKPSSANRSSTLDPSQIRRIEWRLTAPLDRFALAVDELLAVNCFPRALPVSCDPK